MRSHPLEAHRLLLRPTRKEYRCVPRIPRIPALPLCHNGSAVTTPPAGCALNQFDLCDVDADFATFALNFTGTQ